MVPVSVGDATAKAHTRDHEVLVLDSGVAAEADDAIGQAGKAIAFSLCLIHRDTIYDEYLGLDYAVAFDLNLYFYTLRDIINWAITHGIQWYVSSALNYEPKLHLRCDLAPLDLYVAHTSPIVNAFMKRLLPLLEPTRNDPVLHRFPNFREVWG